MPRPARIGTDRGHRTSIYALAGVLALGAPLSDAATWTITPTLGWESTLTNNVNLAPSDQARSDWINQISPGVLFSGVGAHAHVAGSVSLPLLVYAKTSENNYVAPQVTVAGTVEAIERFFFVDASINVSQQYVTPFGATPNNLANATNNRYTAQDYVVSPYLRGRTANDLDYELRDTNTWSTANAISTVANPTGYSNELIGHLTRNARPLGWSLEYDRAEVKFTERQSEITQIARARALYSPDPTVQYSLIGGYEDNQLNFTVERGPVYGAGVKWNPNERTSLDATFEHRFFGLGYNVSYSHRRPLSVFSLQASRDTTSFPQQLASLPAGSNVNQLLNSIFSSRIPDTAERQAAVDQIISDRGLPGTLSTPVVLVAEEITLLESLSATFGILGARNGLFFTAYRSKDEPLGRADFVPPQLLQDINRNDTQIGANVAWTHQLMPTVSLGTNANWSRTTSNGEGGETTRQFAVNGLLSTALSVLTNVYAGIRYQDSHSDVTQGYTELAVFVGITHRFH